MAYSIERSNSADSLGSWRGENNNQNEGGNSCFGRLVRICAAIKNWFLRFFCCDRSEVILLERRIDGLEFANRDLRNQIDNVRWEKDQLEDDGRNALEQLEREKNRELNIRLFEEGRRYDCELRQLRHDKEFLNDKIRRQSDKDGREIQRLSQECQKNQNMLGDLKQNIDKARIEKERVIQRLEQADRAVQENAQELLCKRREIDNLHSTIRDLEQELHQARQNNEHSEDALKIARENCSTQRAEKDQAVREKQALERDKQRLEREKNDLNEQIRNIRRIIAGKDGEIRTLNDRIEELSRSVEDFNRQLTVLQREKQEAEQKIEVLERKVPDELQCFICAEKTEELVKLPCCNQDVGIGCLERHVVIRLATPRDERMQGEGLAGMHCILSNDHLTKHSDLETLFQRNNNIRQMIQQFIDGERRQIATQDGQKFSLVTFSTPCPQCTIKTDYYSTPDSTSSTIQCEVCAHEFCAMCSMNPHNGHTCEEAANQGNRQEIADLRSKISTYEGALQDDKEFRPCPKCDQLISRDPQYDREDCLHIRRSGDQRSYNQAADRGSCEHDLCWVCLQHFKIADRSQQAADTHDAYYNCRFARRDDGSRRDRIGWVNMTETERSEHDRRGYERHRKIMYQAKIDQFNSDMEGLQAPGRLPALEEAPGDDDSLSRLGACAPAGPQRQSRR